MDVVFHQDDERWRGEVAEPLPDTVTLNRLDSLACDTYRLVQPPPYYVYVHTGPFVSAEAPETVEELAAADLGASEQEPLPDVGPEQGQAALPQEDRDADAPGEHL